MSTTPHPDGRDLRATWPTDFVWGEAVPPPERWTRPGIVMFFNLECPGCVSRGVPFLKRLAREYRGSLEVLMVHTSYGHAFYPRDEVVPQLRHFAENFARLPFSVALDLDGRIAGEHGAEGTPHWLVFDRGGRLLRSIYGSQENAQTRLGYLLDELSQAA